MNATEFNHEICKVIQRGMTEGILEKKLDVPSMIGILEMHKGELLRWSQELSRAATQQQIIKATVLPPNGR